MLMFMLMFMSTIVDEREPHAGASSAGGVNWVKFGSVIYYATSSMDSSF